MSCRDLCTTKLNPSAQVTWNKERKRWRTLTKMPNPKAREWQLSEVSTIRLSCNTAKTTLSRTSPNFRLSMDKEIWVLVVPIASQDLRPQPLLGTISRTLLEPIPSIWLINRIVNMNIPSTVKLPALKQILLLEPHPWIIIRQTRLRINLLPKARSILWAVESQFQPSCHRETITLSLPRINLKRSSEASTTTINSKDRATKL